jgi:hypothetical protein
MGAVPKLHLPTHVVDILGSTKGRDQPIMLVDKALEFVSCLDESFFLDDNVVFFDPFCKAGEILMAAALKTCILKHNRKKQLATLGEITRELYGGRFFALAPDERHYLLSKRTFYGNDRSHEEAFTKHIRRGSYLSEVDGRLDKAIFEKEFSSMIEFIQKTTKSKTIVAVGNPPYQENDGGGLCGASTPIYNYFVEALISSQKIEAFTVVIPSRWFSGGRNLDDFRKTLLESGKVKAIRYFEKAEEVFPTVQIKGGVCFLNWDRRYSGLPEFNDGRSTKRLNLSRFDIIPDDPHAFPILEKILNRESINFTSEYSLRGKPFGLRTFHFKRSNNESDKIIDPVRCYSTGRQIYQIDRSEINSNADKIDKYKIAVPATYGKGMRRCTMPVNQFFLVNKGEIVTETYTIVACFDTKKEAETFLKYLQTDFARYMLGLRKLTGRVTKETWAWVPFIRLSPNFIEDELFKLFDLSKGEQEHIRNKVKEWS